MAKFDLQQHVTDKIVAAIVAAIDAGADPDKWEMPWHSMGAGHPKNAATGKAYRGVNIMLLAMEQAAHGYKSPLWASYKQWESLGAQVRKGETGAMIVWAGVAKKERENAATGEKEEIRFRPLRYSKIFNADQVDGFEAPTVEAPNLAERIAHCDDFVTATGATVYWTGDKAFYRPSDDTITMPPAGHFVDTRQSTATENLYSTLFHELTHWTGHKRRCDRDMSGRFGDEAYAGEELVAELGAAFMCARLGISASPRADHATYLASWLRALKNDKRAIFTAASKASAAVDYLAGLVETDGAADDNAGPVTAPEPAEPEPAEPEPAEPAPAPARRGGYVETVQQATPAAEPETFSDKPVTVDGVKYYPKWPWSASYRKHFRAMHKIPRKRPSDIDCDYTLWIMKKHGFDTPAAAEKYIRETQSAPALAEAA